MSASRSDQSKHRNALGPVACRECDLFEICCVIDALPGVFAHQRSALLRSVGPGETIYRAGDPAKSIYAIRKGFAKSERTAEDGRTRVIALHVPGEVIGTESVQAGHYTHDVVAVSPATLCELPIKPLVESKEGASVLSDGLQLLIGVSREAPPPLSGAVEERLARLELAVMTRMQAHGIASKGLCLNLPRQEVADLIGVHVDSLSRSLKRTRTRTKDDSFSLMRKPAHG